MGNDIPPLDANGQGFSERVDLPGPATDPLLTAISSKQSLTSSAGFESSFASPDSQDHVSAPPSLPSPTGQNRTHQNALGINIPPPSISPGPLSAPAVPFPAPALRRTSSSLSGGSASGSTHGSSSRGKKRLRFTPVVDSTEFGRSGPRAGEGSKGSEIWSDE